MGGCWSATPEDLRKPDSIIVDRVGLAKLFPDCHLDEPFAKPRSRTRTTSSGFAGLSVPLPRSR